MNITNPSPAHSEIDIDEDIKQVTGGWRWHLLGTIDHEWSGRSHTQLFRSIVFQLVRVDRPSKCSVFHFRIVRLFVEILSSSAADVYEHGSNRTELPYAHTMVEQVCEKAFALVQERCGRLSTPRASNINIFSITTASADPRLRNRCRRKRSALKLPITHIRKALRGYSSKIYSGQRC